MQLTFYEKCKLQDNLQEEQRLEEEEQIQRQAKENNEQRQRLEHNVSELKRDCFNMQEEM